MLTTNIIWYKGYGIEYDDSGYYTVQYCGDDVAFGSVKSAQAFIDSLPD